MKAVLSAYEQDQRAKRLELALENTEAKIEQLEARLEAELQAKLEAGLEAEKSAQQTGRRDSGYSIAGVPSRASLTSSAPSYMLPTVASASRSLPVPESTPAQQHFANTAFTSEGVGYYYVDGRIVEQVRTGENIGYLKHTRSSAKKTSHPWRAFDHGVTYTTKLREDEARWYGPKPDNNQDISESSDDGLDPPRINNDNLDAVTMLKQATRLRDTNFYTTKPGQASVHFDIQMHSLRQSHDLAQDALFDASREQYPEIWRSYFQYGARSIKFGRDELYSTILGSSTYAHGVRVGPSTETVCSLLDVVFLRNAVAHPRPERPSEVDHRMQDAQSLACSLLDVDRATQIRQLRDDLQQAAQDSFDEIVAREPFCHLPEPQAWAPHHQSLFTEINFEHYRGEDTLSETYGTAVVRAAKAWKLLYQEIGADDPIYLASLERLDGECAEIAAKRAKEFESEAAIANDTNAFEQEESAIGEGVEFHGLAGNEPRDDGW